MLRDAIVVLVAAAVLAPAALAGRDGHAPQTPRQRVVVRTELVRERDGVGWLDAAAGVGLALVSVAVVLLAAAHRPAEN